ncbi:MAG: D-tyrosyl-tRNA(Tyr) deacylase [Acholeplasmatales bacterium]|jgi:D-tyrosyl-tRNA(Tyr) deacylase|nr:D-tyrosyl-tRNA(Tyr) deacylase [Acholeplasmatales bacterium]
MRVIVQVAKDASCEVEGKIVSKINFGFMLLVGFTNGDTLDEVKKLAKKVQGLRVFTDENDKMNLSLSQVNGEVLSISQFTLYADASHGYRPGFTDAMRGEEAVMLYNAFNKELESYGLNVYTGVFGADMHISFTNMGPTTIILDSKEL